MASSSTSFAGNCAYDDNGFVISVKDMDSGDISTLYQNDLFYPQEGVDSGLAGPSTGDGYYENLPERPVSRHSHYAGEKRRRTQSTRRPPPLKVRRYRYVLDGQAGLYTISQISRYGDLYPRRGTALMLRRFYLVNEVLDHTHAVDYKTRRTVPELGGGAECGPATKRSRWIGHGSSKLRNEISPDDLSLDDDSGDELSFSLLSEPSFNSDLSNKSFFDFDFDEDFEAPMKTMSNADDESNESISDSSNDNILDFTISNVSGNPFSSPSEAITKFNDGSSSDGSNESAAARSTSTPQPSSSLDIALRNIIASLPTFETTKANYLRGLSK